MEREYKTPDYVRRATKKYYDKIKNNPEKFEELREKKKIISKKYNDKKKEEKQTKKAPSSTNIMDFFKCV